MTFHTKNLLPFIGFQLLITGGGLLAYMLRFAWSRTRSTR